MHTIITIYIIGISLLIIATPIYLFLRHQRNLKNRAFMMREAIRNGDYSFRLSTKGLLPGEKAMQQTLNDMECDIGKLVAQHEVESWQKLTRVLTHEIMNATAPISSICQAYLSSQKIQGTPYEEGIKAIYDTSKSLTSFVDSYRKLTQLQKPSIEEICLSPFMDSIKALYPELTWHIHIPVNTTMQADKNMLLQVFINLTKNAIEAQATDIDIRCHRSDKSTKEEQHPSISISNNGAPIPTDVAQEMFIPFFTTKPTGSGIGLSISRQMLMMQSFNLSLAEHNVAGYHVTFLIE